MALRYAYNPYRVPYSRTVPGAASGGVNKAGEQGGGGFTDGGSGNAGGGGFNVVVSPGGNEVAAPAAVTFDPAAYYISLDEAIAQAHKEGQYNLDQFKKNYDNSRALALDNQQTELTGLESFLPRTTNLIRNADSQGNADILHYSDVFDARNQPAARGATLGNVALRKELFNSVNPNATEDIAAQRGRFLGDVGTVRSREAADQARVRSEESQPFLSSVLKEQEARNARSNAADQVTSTGFGADSSAGMSILDKFDTDKRVQLEQLDRQDRRIGDQNIYNASTHNDASINTAEGNLANTLVQGEQLFNTVIAPGIRDFTPIQPTPRVTDIGSQIRPMPTVDAGTLQRGFTETQDALSLISPSQVFSGSLDVQKYNSGVGIEALGFQQGLNNTAAGVANTGFNLDKGDEMFQQQLDAFHQGLDARNQSQGLSAISTLATAGLGVLGNLIAPSGGGSSGAFGGVQTGGGIGSVLTGLGTSGTASPVVSPVGIGGGGGVGVSGGGGFAGVSGDANFGGNGVPATPTIVGGGFDSGGGGGSIDLGGDSSAAGDFASSGDSFAFKTKSGERASLAGPVTDQYMRKLTANDFSPDMGAHDYSSPDSGFDYSKTKQGYQPSSFSLSPKDVYNYDGALSGDQNSFLPMGRVKSEASGVDVLPKTEVVKSFVDPTNRDSVLSKISGKGLPTSLALQAYSVFDNWHKMNDTQRTGAAASLLANLGTHLAGYNSELGSLINYGGVNPGSVINLLNQGANVFQNWDNMTTGQQVQAGSHIVGSLGSIAASMYGVGGPIGAAIAFGASALGNAAGTLFDHGLNGLHSFATVASPFSSEAVNQFQGLFGKPIGRKDADHAALFLDPTGIGSVIAAADSLFGLDLDFTSGKPREQKFRDSLRGYLKDAGVVGQDNQIRLADGSSFDFGKDGRAKLPNVGKNIDGKTERNYFDIDWSNPINNQVVAWADPLVRTLFRSDEGKKIIGHIVNAATNADPTDLQQAKSNLRNIAVEGGLTYSKGIQILGQLKNQLKPGEYDVFRKNWQNLMLA